MRVLIVLTPAVDPTTGGVQMATVNLARMLATANHEVGVFSFANEGHASTSPFALFSAPEVGGAGSSENHAALRACLHSFAPRVVINQMPYEHSITETLEQYGPPRRVACLHSTLFSVRDNLDQYADALLPRRLSSLLNNRPGRSALLRIHRAKHATELRRILRSYDRFVMFAPPNLDELQYFVPGFDRSKIALIPHPVEDILPRVPQKQRRLLWVGRVNRPNKRADRIVEVWRRIHEDVPDWEFDIVGDGPMRQELQAVAGSEGLPRLNFLGRQPSRPFFERSAIYLMTSDSEGWGLTTTEAQSVGTVPVLFDSYPIARHLVSNHHSGVLVPRDDMNSFSSEVTRLCHDASFRTRLAEGALVSVRRFSMPAVRTKWHELLSDVSGT